MSLIRETLSVLFVGVGMFEVRGTVVVYLTGIGLLDVAGSSLRTPNVSPLLENILESVTELVAEPEQKYRLVPAENRQRQLSEQVPQPPGGQAEEVVEKG